MRTFQDIFDISAGRHGGAEALEAKLDSALPPSDVAKIPEDRWLAQFTKCIFQAGFNWKVIEAKWDGFEAAFDGFDPGRNAFMDDDMFDALLKDTRIVRNGPKIATVRENASFILSLRDGGGIAKLIAEWPSTEYINLLELLKKEGARLGGNTGQYALRFSGRDSFILSRDVVARLIAEGVIDKNPTSKTAMRAVQAAFYTWMDQSGRGLTQISRVLAMSV